jgi:hypothetical protein
MAQWLRLLQTLAAERDGIIQMDKAQHIYAYDIWTIQEAAVLMHGYVSFVFLFGLSAMVVLCSVYRLGVFYRAGAAKSAGGAAGTLRNRSRMVELSPVQ